MNKAVVLAGGMGTRMLPATNNINKHLLPVYSSEGAVPMIHYPLKTLVKSGISEILIISSREHCGKIIENLGDGREFDANFTYKIQDTSNGIIGIAGALQLCKVFTGEDSFAVILGDNFFEDNFKEEFKNFQKTNKMASIFIKEVEQPNQFGVFSDGYIEEKPEIPKSKFAVAGMYLYTSHVYNVTKNIKPSGRGELEITDVNNYYCRKKSIQVNTISGFWGDMGTPESMIKTQEFVKNSNYTLFGE